MSTENSPEAIAAAYFDAWRTNDIPRYRALLADNATFDGPMGHAGNGDECAEAFTGLAGITTAVIVDKVFVDGPDVTTWFELHTEQGDLAPVVNWSHIEDGKITRIQVTFDPRPLLGPS